MATHYKIGTSDPVIRHDPGAGMWNSIPKTQKMSILKSEIRGHLPHAFLIIGDDAAKHMNHFFRNTGKDYIIDLQDMIDDIPDAKQLYEDEVKKVKQFVGTLPVGTHHITTDTTVKGYNQKEESWNWYYAVGGYSSWITGIAKVESDSSGKRKYRLDYEYKKDRDEATRTESNCTCNSGIERYRTCGMQFRSSEFRRRKEKAI